jgi:hypothetical protein
MPAESSFVLMCLVAEYADAATWAHMMQTQKAVAECLRSYRPLKVRMEGTRVFGEQAFAAIESSDRIVPFEFPCRTPEELNFMLIHVLVSFKRDRDSFVAWYVSRLLDNIHKIDPYTSPNGFAHMSMLLYTSKSDTWKAVVTRLHELLTQTIAAVAKGQQQVCPKRTVSILMFRIIILSQCKNMPLERVPEFMRSECMNYLRPAARLLSALPVHKAYLNIHDHSIAEWAAHVKAAYYGEHIVHVGKGGGRYYINKFNTRMYI